MATRSRWRSIVLVTSRPQDTRARIRVGRCFAGQIYVVAMQQPRYDRPYQIAYEWAAMFRALVIQRAC